VFARIAGLGSLKEAWPNHDSRGDLSAFDGLPGPGEHGSHCL